MSVQTEMPEDVRAAFERLPSESRKSLLQVRELIFETAASTQGVGNVEEALRWGEPAYLTPETRSGSTIRLGVEKSSGQPALFFNCQTRLVEDFRQQFGDRLSYSKNRAVLLDPTEPLDISALAACVKAALRYHKTK